MQSFRFDHVFYTGSIPVGKIIYQLAAKDLIPVTLELGGKSPQIVLRDADLQAAASDIAWAIFYNQGESCNAGSRLICDAGIKSELLAEVKKRTPQGVYGAQGGLLSSIQADIVGDPGEVSRRTRFSICSISLLVARCFSCMSGKGSKKVELQSRHFMRRRLMCSPTRLPYIGVSMNICMSRP